MVGGGSVFLLAPSRIFYVSSASTVSSEFSHPLCFGIQVWPLLSIDQKFTKEHSSKVGKESISLLHAKHFIFHELAHVEHLNHCFLRAVHEHGQAPNLTLPKRTTR